MVLRVLTLLLWLPLRPTSPTCAHDSSEDPALPIAHWLAACGMPLLQDGHTASPLGGVDTIHIILTPIAIEHSVVVITVYLKRSHEDVLETSVPATGWGVEAAEGTDHQPETQGRPLTSLHLDLPDLLGRLEGGW